ncbi:ATP-binding protein [Cysteiniphilum sp. JM-1]|uniref:ATP-binding protein n=1 Tax=Cysteiniphilum sp. JM-1 TaxID=2610891 RepID=UPI0012466A6F|nr:ATP-binding protein [Cysteiniphilum sp. JM-1]
MFKNRLSIQLAAPIIVLTLLVMVIIIFAFYDLNQTFNDTVDQEIHRSLASYVVANNSDLKHGKVDEQCLRQIFNNLMQLGPEYEVYAVDKSGRLIATSEANIEIKRDIVDLKPIKNFLSDKDLPIYGTNPASLDELSTFSVAPISKSNNTLVGYLYIVLNSHKKISSNQQYLWSTNFEKILLFMIFMSLLILLLIIYIYLSVTKPILRLNKQMLRFRESDFTQLPSSPKKNIWKAIEINSLESHFDELSFHIAAQFTRIKSVEKLRKDLISYVSHDFKTPLASLKGYLETWLILNEGAENKSYIEIALKNANNLQRLIEQLLEIAYLQTSQQKLSLEPILIADLANDVLNSFRLNALEKGVLLTLDCDDTGVYVNADIRALERILTNLIDNAIKYSFSGKQVVLSIKSSVDVIIISIKDQGKGIPEDELAYVFDPSYRAKNSVQSQHSMGLGLTIVKLLLELHGSSIYVESKLGKGTSFSFELPMDRV